MTDPEPLEPFPSWDDLSPSEKLDAGVLPILVPLLIYVFYSLVRNS